MGVVKNVGYDKFPKQDDFLNKRVKVCFNYNTTKLLWGTIIRADAESPGETIIKLDDGRIILSTECQHSFPTD